MGDQRTQITQLRRSLLEKSWFGFDLDDTLHEFRRASGKATAVIFDLISAEHHVSVADLKDKYALVLGQTTSNAFSDGQNVA